MSDYLYARPSIIEGIGRNMDLFGSMNIYNYSKNEVEADKTAIASDWLAIYTDLYKAWDTTLCQIEQKKIAD